MRISSSYANRTTIVLFCALQAAIVATSAGGSPLTLNGYSKAFAIIERPAAIGGLPGGPTAWSLHDALRLKLSWKPAESASLNLAYGLVPQLRNPGTTGSGPADGGARRYRIDDVRPRLCPWRTADTGHFSAWHNVDRAYLRLSADWADLYLGRQAIAWGSARVINPTDVIAPYPFGELDTEERVGVDAVKAVVPIGGICEITAGIISGRRAAADSSALFLRGKAGIARTDLTASVTRFRRNVMAGLDLARAIGGAGAWLETAVIWYALPGPASPHQRPLARLSLGSDYRFGDRWYGSCEYHYSGAGEARPERYARNAAKSAFREGTVYLMARHYLAPSASYQATPLISLSATPLCNLCDGSVLLSARAEYNATQDTYLSLGVLWGIGKRSRLDPTAGGVDVRSEFGNYPLSGHVSYGVYF